MRLMGLVALLTLCATSGASAAPMEQTSLASPDGRVVIDVGQDEGGVPTYSVRFGGQPVIAPSALSLELAAGGAIGPGATFVAAARSKGDTTYKLVAGKTAEARDRYNELRLSFRSGGAASRPFDIIFRAYDDGAAFRYRLPPAGAEPVVIRAENTRFVFPKDYGCWGLNLGRFTTSHEGEYDPVPASRIRDGNLFDVPLVCKTGNGTTSFALAEADLKDWAGLYFTGAGDGALAVQSRLSPQPDDPGVAVRTRIGADVHSPWRVVMLADSPVKLIESTLITNLSAPPTFDPGWVKPGNTAWDWWNNATLASVPKAGMNNATMKGFIDFAAASGLDYMLIDDGWYLGSGLGGTVRPGTDVTRSIPEIDVPALVAYGQERGVGLWLWVHWRALQDQMDEALAQYQRLGIKGLKVDFMDRDDQQMVDFYHRLLGRAAEHKLMINLHGATHPTGLIRTYPNYLTQEGVMGAEYNKWSRRVTATHNLTLPFTRMLVGPMDYTPGGFRNVSPQAFRAQFEAPRVQTTQAQNMAMYVVYESGLQVIADSPDVYRGRPGFEFIAEVPAAWDETRALAGDIGEYVVIARRKGRDWWIGAMNNEKARTIKVPLDFLGAGSHRAIIHADGARPDAIVTSERALRSKDQLSLRLASGGGAAIRIQAAD